MLLVYVWKCSFTQPIFLIKNALDFLKAFGKSKFGVGENVFGAGDGDDPN